MSPTQGSSGDPEVGARDKGSEDPSAPAGPAEAVLQLPSSSLHTSNPLHQLAEQDLPIQLRFANYQRGASPFLDLRPMQANVPPARLSSRYRPQRPEGLLSFLQQHGQSASSLKQKALQALEASAPSPPGLSSQIGHWSIWVDGSHFPSIDASTEFPADTSKSGWSFILCRHSSPDLQGPYAIVELACGRQQEARLRSR